MVNKDTVPVDQNSLVATKVVEKNERIITFSVILFESPVYYKSGDLVHLIPAQLTNKAMEMVSSASTNSE